MALNVNIPRPSAKDDSPEEPPEDEEPPEEPTVEEPPATTPAPPTAPKGAAPPAKKPKKPRTKPGGAKSAADVFRPPRPAEDLQLPTTLLEDSEDSGDRPPPTAKPKVKPRRVGLGGLKEAAL